MKKLIWVVALLIIFLVHDETTASVGPPSPVPQDTTIRILLIKDTRLSQGDIDAAINYLQLSWDHTDLTTVTPTSIQIVGSIPAGASVFSGDDEDQLEKIRILAETPIIPTVVTLRDFHGADVVIGLSSDIDNSCGLGSQDHWLRWGPYPFPIPFLGPEFVEDADGLDLREANDDYIAVVQLSGHLSCVPTLLAHEFGHLLGAGHWNTIYQVTGGLFSNSQAYKAISPYSGTTGITALGAGPQTADCTSSNPTKCFHISSYSDYSFNHTDERNSDAINKTARSVANYRRGGGAPVQPDTCADGIDNDDDNLVDSADSDCAVCNEEICPIVQNPPPGCDATVAPIGMAGWVLQVCVPGTTYTEYQVVWAHACPQQVSYYEVWAAQPITDPSTFRWFAVPPYTRVIVGGPSARIRVRSCGVGGCSLDLSAASFLAVDLC